MKKVFFLAQHFNRIVFVRLGKIKCETRQLKNKKDVFLFLFYEAIAKTALPTFGDVAFEVSRMFNRSWKAVSHNEEGIKEVKKRRV